MNSLSSFCVTFPIHLQTQPTKLTTAIIKAEHKTVNNNNNNKNNAVLVSHHQTQTTSSLFGVNENPNLLKRREAIVASIGIISSSILFLPSQFEIAEASSEVSSPCEFTVSPSGLAFCDKVIGNGAQAVQGQLIKAHYTGKLENGKIFDSSYNRGKPLTFRVGAGEVIKGWDQGILGTEGVPPMLAGGKRTLMIPPELGYGVRGAGCRGGTCIIPPNSVLIFDVEFLGKV